MVGSVIQPVGCGIVNNSGGIIKFNGQSSGGGIDDYFDPSTHVASETNFIKFLEAGIYTSDVIGYKVILSNSYTYNNGSWTIGDVNHNGTTNTYDLISDSTIEGSTIMFSYDRSKQYDDSDTIRPYMINFGNSFSINSHIIPIYYSDKATIPSYNDFVTTMFSSRKYPVIGNWPKTSRPIWLKDICYIDYHAYALRSDMTRTDLDKSSYYSVCGIIRVQ